VQDADKEEVKRVCASLEEKVETVDERRRLFL
jgi:hypothetical protein